MADVVIRPAQAGDGAALFDVTRQSIAGLGGGHYTARQIAGWMGDRTAAFYEGLIVNGRVTVAERDGAIVGFVDAEPGEVTRLFVLPAAAGIGLGKTLLRIGIESASVGHAGPIKLEATRNAEAFYRRNGFRAIGDGQFSHGLGGEAIEVVHMELS